MEEERQYRGHEVGLEAFETVPDAWKAHWRVRILDADAIGLPHFADVLVGQQVEPWTLGSPEAARDRVFADAKEAVDKLVDRDEHARPHYIVTTSENGTGLSIARLLGGDAVFSMTTQDSVVLNALGQQSRWAVRNVEIDRGCLRAAVWPADEEAAEQANVINSQADLPILSIRSGAAAHEFTVEATAAAFWVRPYPPLHHVVSMTLTA